MLKPIEDSKLLIEIMNDLRCSLEDLPFFKKDRVNALYNAFGYIRNFLELYSYKVHTFKSNNDFIEEADRTILNLKKSLTIILRVFSRVKIGTGSTTIDDTLDALSKCMSYSVVFKALRFHIKHKEYRGVLFDEDIKILELRYPNEQIKYHEALNSLTIKLNKLSQTKQFIDANNELNYLKDSAKRVVLKMTKQQEMINPICISEYPVGVVKILKQQVSLYEILEGSQYTLYDDLNLTSQYTFKQFKDVLHGLYIIASIIMIVSNGEGWLIREVDTHVLIDELSIFLQLDKGIVAIIVNDLTYNFTNEKLVEIQPLIYINKNKVIFVPLYVLDRTANFLYIEIAKILYATKYNAEQEKMTKSFEQYVEETIKEKVKNISVSTLKFDGIGQIDRIISDTLNSIMILVEIKHLTTYRNDHIEKGIRQLICNEKLVDENWDYVSKSIKVWNGKSKPAKIVKLLVTNWFRGTVDNIPGDITILNIDELKGIEKFDNLANMAEYFCSFKRKISETDIEFADREVSLFGYTIKYKVADFASLEKWI